MKSKKQSLLEHIFDRWIRRYAIEIFMSFIIIPALIHTLTSPIILIPIQILNHLELLINIIIKIWIYSASAVFLGEFVNHFAADLLYFTLFKEKKYPRKKELDSISPIQHFYHTTSKSIITTTTTRTTTLTHTEDYNDTDNKMKFNDIKSGTSDRKCVVIKI